MKICCLKKIPSVWQKLLFYMINIVASQNSSRVLKLVSKGVEPNFISLSYMVQDVERWATFHFYSMSERSCVKARLDGGGGTVWGVTGGAKASLNPVIAPCSEPTRPWMGLPVSLRTPHVYRQLHSLGLWSGPSDEQVAGEMCASVTLQPPRAGHGAVVPSLAALTRCGWRPLQQGVGEAGAWVCLSCCLIPVLVPSAPYLY